jgi:SAM-dependent methyltransferase
MSEQIRSDFDRLALLDDDAWNHNNQYHPFLLSQVPANCQQALEIGSGTGAFSRLLACRSRQVLGLDLAPQMVRLAQERSQQHPNLEYQVADVLKSDFSPASFDCIVSIATFHHLPLAEMLQKIQIALRPGGVLLVLDLFHSETLNDAILDLLAVPFGLSLRLLKTGRLRETGAVRDAWAAHGVHDVYLSLAEIRQVSERFMPGVQVRRHLLWRYSLVWKKPPL